MTSCTCDPLNRILPYSFLYPSRSRGAGTEGGVSGGFVPWRTLWNLWLEDTIINFLPSTPRWACIHTDFFYGVCIHSQKYTATSHSVLCSPHKAMEPCSRKGWSVVMTHVSWGQNLIHRKCSIIICGVTELVIVLSYNVFNCLGAETQLC